MRLIGKSLVWVAAFGLILSTLYMRYETAAAGISPLTTAMADAMSPRQGAPLQPGTVFQASLTLHHMAGFALCWLIGLFALTTGGVTRGIVWLVGMALALCWAVGMMVIFAPEVVRRVVDPLMFQSRNVLAVPYAHITLSLSIIGAATLLSRGETERRIARVISLAAAVLGAYAIADNVTSEPRIALPMHLSVLAVLGLLAFVSFLLSDEDRPGAGFVFVGLVSTLVGLAVSETIISQLSREFVAVSLWPIAAQHLTQLSLPLFLGLALLDIRLAPTWPRTVIWAFALSLGALLLLVFAPMAQLGMIGQLSGYADFPRIFAPENLQVSSAAFVLIIVGLVGVHIMRRRRAR